MKDHTPVATLDALLAKPRRIRDFHVEIPGPDGGEPVKMKLVGEALSGDAFDDLVAQHPPTKKQREDGFTWNTDTFLPALIAATLREPHLTYEQAKQLWDSEQWSSGELNSLANFCIRLSQEGLGVPFTVTASAETPDSP